jgi:hypothetical protein
MPDLHILGKTKLLKTKCSKLSFTLGQASIPKRQHKNC